ncbi:tyrosine-type recombinase/integrase [Photobacterium leiognathi]|uniref:tyrosine-type recombinase/integrase n=1 Tax=Photobacterium leiognathi TaxID=553611 RepID=UPI0029819773|nr:site-specific integrase [Photobacterium leiognathi]
MINLKKIPFYYKTIDMTSYDLLDLRTGESVEFYASYLNNEIQTQIRSRNKCKNTIDAKASDLKVFFEYIYNAQEIFFEKKLNINASLLSEIILSYPEYLTYGIHAKSTIAKETAKITNRKIVKNTTANRMLSTVNKFLSASSNHHQTLKIANDKNLINIELSSENIHKILLEKRLLSTFEKKLINEKSIIAQVVQGGAKYSNTNLFKTSYRGLNNLQEYKHFPIEYLEELLDKANTYRDRALWALCAGAGLRISEASQLLLEDINIVTEELKIFSYKDRIECFEGLNYEDIKYLSFKGRENNDAYFIEPFKRIFFESITLYLKFERPKALKHKYLFVTLSNKNKGKPLFATARSSLNRTIKIVQKKINCPKKNSNGDFYTIHSLRHFYGFWLLNYHTTPCGNTFKINEVQLFMGHAKLASTQKYAVIDKLISKEKMRQANSLLENKTLSEYKKERIKALLDGK